MKSTRLNLGNYKLFLLFLFYMISKVSIAQIVDTSRVKIDVGLTGSYQEGNFERIQLINQLDFSIASKNRKWEFTTRHLYLYQKVFANETQDDYLTRNFLAYKLNPKWDVFAAFFYEKLLIKRIDAHPQFGLGSRYTLVSSPRAFLQVGLMGSYSNKEYASSNFSDFNNQDSNEIEAFFVTPVLDFRAALVPRKLIFTFLGWYQQDISESENWRYVFDTALLVSIWKGLNFKTKLNVFQENINLERVQANDLFLTYGLSYKFRK